MGSQWKCVEDFRNDLMQFSEDVQNDEDEHVPIPEPILQYNARIGANHNVSIFDTEFPFEDNVARLIPGRGKGRVTHIIRPGITVNSCPEEEDDLKRRLREVSGMGYSNELIEQRFKKSSKIIDQAKRTDEEEFSDIPDKNDFQYPSLQTSRSPSKTKENQERPPPLSLILKGAKENDKKKTLRPDAPEFKPGSTSPSYSTVSSKKMTLVDSSRTSPDQDPSKYNQTAKPGYATSNGSSSSRSSDQNWRKENNGRKSDSDWRKSSPESWRSNKEPEKHVWRQPAERSSNGRPRSSLKSSGSSSGSPRKRSDFKSDEENSYRQVLQTKHNRTDDGGKNNGHFDLGSKNDFPSLG